MSTNTSACITVHLLLQVAQTNVGSEQPNYNTDLEKGKAYMTGVIQPALCCFGIIGNILNIVVLSRKRFSISMDKSNGMVAIAGLLALALSDMCYCICALPYAFLSGSETFFTSRSFGMVYQMYGKFAQNIFIHTSTWLTVHIAITRYIVVCFPLHARRYVNIKVASVSIVTVLVACVLVNIPNAWRYTTYSISCDEEDLRVYVLDQGYFVENKMLNAVFSNIWMVFGFLIPLIVLIFCNVYLIKGLRASSRMRREMRVPVRARNPQSNITPTLIAIICMFIVFVTPTEVLSYYYYHANNDQVEVLNFIIVLSNILQTLNFSINFIMYCIVNSQFRSTLRHIINCGRGCPDSLAESGNKSTGMFTSTVVDRSILRKSNTSSPEQINVRYSELSDTQKAEHCV